MTSIKCINLIASKKQLSSGTELNIRGIDCSKSAYTCVFITFMLLVQKNSKIMCEFRDLL